MPTKPEVQLWGLKSKKFLVICLVIVGAYVALLSGKVEPDAALGVIWKAAAAYCVANAAQKFAGNGG